MEKAENYIIKDIIYKSKNSTIYKGHNEKNNIPVILKELNQDNPRANRLSEFKREYKTLKKLKFENSIKVYDFFPYQHSYLLVVEDFGGKALNQYDFKSFNLNDFFDIAIQCCEQLQGIHSHNIIHKDINPSNIIWNEKDRKLKIIDFGISIIDGVESIESNHHKQIEGTIPYISPEQTGRINRLIDQRSDLYSLGISFYQILTGKLPFESEDSNEVIHQHIAVEAENPQNINTEIPKALSDIILKLISKSPNERYQSVHGLIEDLIVIKDNNILNFTPGQMDYSYSLTFSKKLFGRQKDIETLISSCNRTLNDKSFELLFLSGSPGIGKSTLVKELSRHVLLKKAFFLSGKFEKIKNNPYLAFQEVFSQFIKNMLSQEENQILFWKKKILKALKDNGRVMTNVFPDLEKLIGSQPEIPQLNQLESQTRFNLVFQDFLKSITSEIPFIIFLDDIQWADHSSLSLIKDILEYDNIDNLMLILSYRDNEIDDTHFFNQIQTEVKNINNSVFNYTELQLENLNVDDINLWLENIFNQQNSETEILAKLIFKKTNGNPFFIKQIIISFYEKNQIYFDLKNKSWKWDYQNIEKSEITENVVDLIVSEIKHLDTKLLDILKMASCLGGRFSLIEMIYIANLSFKELYELLSQAIRQEYLHLLSNEFKYLSDEENPALYDNIYFKFSHDRIIQSFYSLLNENEIKEYHYKIANYYNKLYIDNDEYLYDTINHYNQSLNLINESQKIEISQLNYTAGLKAKDSSAYSQALEYFSIGKSLISDREWKSHFEFCFYLYLDLATSYYFDRNYKEAEKLFNYLLDKTNDNILKIEIYSVMLRLYRSQGDFKKAVDTGIKGLILSGIACNGIKEIVASIQEENQKIIQFLQEKGFGKLRELESCSNEKAILIKRLCLDLHPAAFMSGQFELFGLITIKMVSLSIEYGNSYISPYAYAGYGISAIVKMDKFGMGFEFGQLALSLLKDYPNKYIEQRCYFVFAFFMSHWKESFTKKVNYYQHSYNLALDTGDLTEAGYAASNLILTKFYSHFTLDELLLESDNYLKLIKKTNDPTVLNIFSCSRQLIRGLRGETSHSLSLSDDFFDEEFNLNLLKNEMKNFQLVGLLLTSKLILAIVNQDYQKAFEISTEVNAILMPIKGLFYYCQFIYLRTLSITAIYNELNEEEKQNLYKEIEANLELIKGWSQLSSENFEFMELNISAEKARINNKKLEAIELFDRSMEICQRQNLFLHSIITNQLLIDFYSQINNKKITILLKKDLNTLLIRWQAAALVDKSMTIQTTTVANTKLTTGSTELINIDTNSILKMSQAISSEIVLSGLINKMMQILMENAGAEKGIFILFENNIPYVKAVKHINEENSTIYDKHKMEDFSQLPKKIIRHVINNQEKLIIANIEEDLLFHDDSYVKENKLKSIFCFPLIFQTKTIGLIYFENNLSENVFSDKHFEILNLLSSQITTSLYNSLLYDNLDKLVKDRTIELSKSEERYRTLIHLSPDAIVIHDLNKVLFVNNAAVSLMGGKSINELVNINLQTIIKSDSFEKFNNFIHQVEEKEKNLQFPEIVLNKFDQSTINVEAASVQIIYEDREAILTIFRDITERKRVEHLRENTQRMLRHDLKSPLNSVIGLSDILMARSSLKEKDQKFLKTINESGYTMLNMIDSSLNLFKMEEGIYQIIPDQIDICSLFKELNIRFSSMLNMKNLKIDYYLFDKEFNLDQMIIVNLEKMNLDVLFSNLIKNAIEASPDKEIIRINIKDYEEEIEINIHNEGEIPLSIREDFFDRYSTSGKIGGTGLGTYSAQLIVKTYRGEIDFETGEQGTTLIVKLPKTLSLADLI